MLKALNIYNYECDSEDLYIIDSLLDTMVSPLIGGFMIIWMVYRSHAISRLAHARRKMFPFSFQIRASLLLFLGFLNLLIIIFTSATHFLLFDDEDPLAIISSGVMMVIFISEVVLLRFEFLKGVPFFIIHKLFWVVLGLLASLNFVLDCMYLEQTTIMHFGIDACRCVDSLVLVFYSLFIKPQDLKASETEHILKSNKQPLIAGDNFDLHFQQDKEKMQQHRTTKAEEFSGSEFSSSKNLVKIKIEVKSKLIYKKNESFYEIKVFLNHNEKVYKVLRSLRSFYDLERHLLYEVKAKLAIFPKSLEEIVSFSKYLDPKDPLNSISYTNATIIQSLNQYLSKIVSRLELLNLHLALFLEIPEPYKKNMLQANNQQIQALMRLRSRKAFIEVSQNPKESTQEQGFDVFEMEFLQECDTFVTIRMNLLELPSEKWTIMKRKEEINEFIKNYRRRFFEEEEGLSCQEKFKRVCNDCKENFNEKRFLEFLGVCERAANMINVANSETENGIMKDLKVEIVDFLEVFDKEKKKESVYYNILVESEEKNDRKVVFFKNIYKKYKHFKELHEILLRKFPDYHQELPTLPKKAKIFGLDCKSCEIKEELERYLQQLVKFKFISQSLAFRRFLNVCFLKGSFIEEPFVERNVKMTFTE